MGLMRRGESDREEARHGNISVCVDVAIRQGTDASDRTVLKV